MSEIIKNFEIKIKFTDHVFMLAEGKDGKPTVRTNPNTKMPKGIYQIFLQGTELLPGFGVIYLGISGAEKQTAREGTKQRWHAHGQKMTGIFKNAKVSGAATSVATLYAVPSGKYSTLHSIFITNRYNLEDLYVNLLINDGSTDYYVAYLLPVPANLGAIIERPINLQSTETLKVQASRASSIDIVANLIEFTV